MPPVSTTASAPAESYVINRLAGLQQPALPSFVPAEKGGDDSLEWLAREIARYSPELAARLVMA